MLCQKRQKDVAATQAAASLDGSLLSLHKEVETHVEGGLEAPVALFGQGRALLAVITVASVTLASAASLAACSATGWCGRWNGSPTA